MRTRCGSGPSGQQSSRSCISPVVCGPLCRLSALKGSSGRPRLGARWGLLSLKAGLEEIGGSRRAAKHHFHRRLSKRHVLLVVMLSGHVCGAFISTHILPTHRHTHTHTRTHTPRAHATAPGWAFSTKDTSPNRPAHASLRWRLPRLSPQGRAMTRS